MTYDWMLSLVGSIFIVALVLFWIACSLDDIAYQTRKMNIARELKEMDDK